MTKAFFAFPAAPQDLYSTIQAGSALVNRRKVSLETWPQMDVFGAFIADQVRESVKRAKHVFCDVTVANENVYYELGYAIGLGKRIGPTVNRSFADAVDRLRKDGIFDNVGYRTYENSKELREILQATPKQILTNEYRKEINFRQPLFFLDTESKTDFRNEIVSSIKKSQVLYRSFDPLETPRMSTFQIIGDISSSSAIIIPFLNSHIVDYSTHNLRAAFVAGLAHGLGRPSLFIRMKAGLGREPADFRDAIRYVRDPSEVSNVVIPFAQEALVALQTIESIKPSEGISALRAIQLGAVAAENEFISLSQYFVETSEFDRTVRGEVKIVTGRKGSGKSAIFFMAKDALLGTPDTLVVDLTPESHQLVEFREQLKAVTEAGVIDHTLAAFWHYVILSEIAVKIKFSLRKRAQTDSRTMEFVDAIEKALGDLVVWNAGDFTSRLNRLAHHFRQEMSSSRDGTVRDVLSRLTTTIYSRSIPELKRLVLQGTKLGSHIVILFDNIDKGWPSSGVEELDTRIVRLLLETLVKIGQDFAQDNRQFKSTVFLRNDVFELLMSDTPDRGKAGRVNIDWTDREKLKQVILRRLQASLGGLGASFDQLWYSRFPTRVGETDSFDYFVDHTLMRPRFLIAAIELAVANAINRGHTSVLEQDCVDAVRQHAYALLDDFGYEIRDVSGLAEDIMYSFIGCPQTLSSSAIIERLTTGAGLTPNQAEEAFRLMLWYGALGVVHSDRTVTYIYDVDYKLKRLEAEMRRVDYQDTFELNSGLFIALQ